jgi:hypothetical protein
MLFAGAVLSSAAPQGFLLWQPEHGDGNRFSLPIHAVFVLSFPNYR